MAQNDGDSGKHRIGMDAVARSWDQNPFKNGSLTALVIMHEGADVLLSVLTQIAPGFVLDPDETDLLTMQLAVCEARPQWFPNNDDWHSNSYAMIKEVMREHDISLNLITSQAALAWMERRGHKTATAGEVKEALAAGE